MECVSKFGIKGFYSNLIQLNNIKYIVKFDDLWNGLTTDFLFIGSATLALYGIRENRDLDIVVPTKTFISLRFNKNLDFRLGGSGFYKYSTKDNNIEIFGQMPSCCGRTCLLTKQLLKESVAVESYNFMPLNQVLAMKKYRRTKQDLDDIKLIENYLKR